MWRRSPLASAPYQARRDEEDQRERRPAARHARAVGAVGEPGAHDRRGKQRGDGGHEIAALVAPQVADGRPGAQIEEEVVGVHDHVHDRPLDRGGGHDQR